MVSARCSVLLSFLSVVWAQTNTTLPLHLGTLIPWTGWSAGPLYASAASVAVEEINNNPDLLPGYHLVQTTADDGCGAATAMLSAFELFTGSELDVIVGPACSVGCEPVSLLATVWELPLISWGCGASALSSQTEHPNFVRTVSPWTKIGAALLSLFREYDWHKAGLISSTENLWSSTSSAIGKLFAAEGVELQIRSIEPGSPGDAPGRWTSVLEELQAQDIRVIHVEAYPSDCRDLLLTAHSIGMTGEGYVWIFVSLTTNFCQAALSWMDDPENDLICASAAEGNLEIGPGAGSGPAYDAFKNKLVEGQKRFFNLTIELSDIDGYAEPLYSGVYLYAHAMTAVINAGGDPRVRDPGRDFAALTATSFVGPAGLVVLDEKGDREADWDFRNLRRDPADKLNNPLATVAIYKAASGTLVAQEGATIVWPGGMTEAPVTRVVPAVWQEKSWVSLFSGVVLFLVGVVFFISLALFIHEPIVARQQPFLFIIILVGLLMSAEPVVVGIVGVLNVPCAFTIITSSLTLPCLCVPVLVHARCLSILSLLVHRERKTRVETFQVQRLLRLKARLAIPHVVGYTCALLAPSLLGLLLLSAFRDIGKAPTPLGCVDMPVVLLHLSQFIYLGAILLHHVYNMKHVCDSFFFAREYVIFAVVFLCLGGIYLVLAGVAVRSEDGLSFGIVLTLAALLVVARRGIVIPFKSIYGTSKQGVSHKEMMAFVLEDALYTSLGFDYFLAHCTREFNQENLLCWRAVEDFMHKVAPDEFLDLWYYFMAKDSFVEINISDGVFEKMKELVIQVQASDRIENVRKVQDTLREVQRELMKTMKKDILPRFMKTEYFGRFLRKEPFDPAKDVVSLSSPGARSSRTTSTLASAASPRITLGGGGDHSHGRTKSRPTIARASLNPATPRDSSPRSSMHAGGTPQRPIRRIEMTETDVDVPQVPLRRITPPNDGNDASDHEVHILETGRDSIQ